MNDEPKLILGFQALKNFRICSPEETLNAVKGLMPILGITRLANVTGLDHIGIPVFMVFRPNSMSLSVTQGKGLTKAAAKASGLMESIEQYHAERTVLPLKFASRNDLRYTHELVDPARLPRINTSIFHDDLSIFWIESQDLVSGVQVWIPFEMVHLNLTVPLLKGSGFFPLGSNGLASGNHHYEAFIHGICEVIERDALTLWKHGPAEYRLGKRIDLETVDDPDCLDLLRKFDKASVAVQVWDITSDLGVPVYAARIGDLEPSLWRTIRFAEGMGCHPFRHVALTRALTEAAQSRLTFIAGSRDDLGVELFQQQRKESQTQERVQPIEGDAPRDFHDAPNSGAEDLEGLLRFVLDQLVSSGFDRVLAVDMTREEFGIPVVRIVIPGLEGHHEQPNYVPGARVRALYGERR